MESDYQHVLEKQRKRFEVLRAIYRDTNGEEYKLSTIGDIKQTTGISGNELIHILQYLENEGLIEPLAPLYEGDEFVSIRILHQGVLEVEAAISRPEESTEHFLAQVFNITNNAPVATQQFGNNNTANIAQNIGSDVAEILRIIDALRQDVSNIPPESQIVAIEALDDIEEEVKTPTRASRIRGGLLALWSVAKDVASFANAITALAQRFGMDHLLS